jgi:hypothetical protein
MTAVAYPARLTGHIVWLSQLLRRYSGLEGEVGEARKKVALRDDRIKQLEHSCRLAHTHLNTSHNH